MTKTKADTLYESLANFTDEEGAIECGAKMRDYARQLERENTRLRKEYYETHQCKIPELERENTRLTTYNRQAEDAAEQHKTENARLRDALENLVAQCKSGDDITAWWKAAVERAESALLPNQR